jgi:hypothetical protein
MAGGEAGAIQTEEIQARAAKLKRYRCRREYYKKEGLYIHQGRQNKK